MVVNPAWITWLAQSLGGELWIRRGRWTLTPPVTNERLARDIAIHARTYGKPEPKFIDQPEGVEQWQQSTDSDRAIL